MRGLGISIYPSQGKIEEIQKYIELAGKYGFTRIFTCLISEQDKMVEQVVEDFKKLVNTANECGLKVVADVEPDIFKKVGATHNDLKFFHHLGLTGIRLNMAFSGIEESIMSYNPYGLKIEVNASDGTKYIDNILSYRANTQNIWACHNFYPQVSSGLGYEYFIKCSKQFKDLGIRTAAFVNSSNAEVGLWTVSEGLCTLEMHRDTPVDVQAKSLFETGLIDDVIVANMFASEGELRRLSELNKEMIEYKVDFAKVVPELQKNIVLDEFHFNRGDVSDYMKNSGKSNVVAKIAPEELFLLDYLEPWGKFGFNENNNE